MKFKRILSLLASAAMTISALCGAMSITASADSSGEIGDGVEFSWVQSTKTLTISYTGEGSGEMADFAKAADSPWYTSRTSINTVVVEEGITRIGDNFVNGGANQITSITLPSTLKSIGDTAFASAVKSGSNVALDLTKCTSLETIGESAFNTSKFSSIKLPDSLKAIPNKAFYNCSALTEFSFGNGVESIGEQAFYSCSNLTSLEIPNSVTSIATKAFQSCSKLQSITLSNKLETIEDSTFISCSKLEGIEIPASVKTIGPNAFSGCSGLLSLTTNEGLTGIGEKAFYNCSKLATVSKFPNSLTTIGNNAFQSCAAIPNVDFLDTEGSITLGDYVFQSCNGITTVTIPKSVKTIGNYVFQSCSGIQEVTIPATVEKFGSAVFYSCSNLTKATFANGVTSIPANIFYSCSKLETLVKPTTITEIGGSAFYGCKALTSFSLTNVTKIGSSAFQSTGLTSIDVLGNVTEVGSSAFASCSSLTSATIRSGVQTIGSSAFSSTKIKTIQIPASVTSLGSSAFSSCSELTKVEFLGTSGITKLEDSLFSSCKVLTGITIPASVTEIGSRTFQSCAAITDITIPANVKTIGSGAFNGAGLTSVTIPATVETIAGGTGQYGNSSGVFAGCNSLESATIENGITTIPGNMFANDKALTSVSIPYSVKTIESYAFQGCTSLTGSVNLAKVSEVGEGAFYKCTGLTSMTIPNGTVGQNAFSGCTNLSTVIFEDDVTSIGAKAFEKCTSLTSITLPKNIESIVIGSTNTFLGCTSLTEINIPEGGTSYSSVNGVLFNADKSSLLLYPLGKTGSYTIPTGTKSVGKYAFYNCTNLQSVTIPSTVETIENFAFSASGLTSLSLPNGIKSIGDGTSSYTDGNAFSSCKSLTSVSIPASLKEIPVNSFGSCSALTKLTIADGVETLGYQAFYQCTALQSVKMPDSITKLGSSVFSYCSSLKEVEISKSLTVLPNYTFQNTGLESITIPDNITALGDGDTYNSVFSNCKSLKTVVLPDTLKSIGKGNANTFQNCSALEYLVIPESVTNIPMNTFPGCSNENLQLHIMGVVDQTMVTSSSGSKIDTSAFTNVKGTVYVYDQTTYDNIKPRLPATATLEMPLDFTELHKAIAKARAVESTDYTSGSYASVAATLAIAESVVSDLETTQKAADSATKALNKALDGLAPLKDEAVFEALQDTIKNADALVESDYGKDSYAVLASAIEAAKAITDGDLISEMNNAKKAIEDAIDALVPVYLSPDISLDKKIYPYDDSITIDDITDDLTTLIAEGVADEKMAGTTQIRFTFDDAPNTQFNQWNYMLFRAIIGERDGETEPVVNQNNVQGTGGNAAANTGLKGLTATLTLTEPIKVGDVYRIDASSCGWWNQDGVDYSYVITNAELLDADGKLIGKAGIEPKADLQSSIKDAEAVDTTKYTEDSVAALQNALAEAKALDEQVYPVPSKMQSAIDAIKDAISKLQSTAPTTADYTAVDAALAKIPSDLSGYTDESVTALNNAKNAVVRGLSADEQARVDGFATAIEEAIQKLEKKQDSSQQGPGNNDNKKPGGQNPSANDKVNAAKDKAQKVMDKAKLKKLSVKSKAKKKITVKWKKVAGAKGYQVEVSKDKNFKQSKRVLLKNVKGKKLVIKKKLKSKKIYFVRVRAYATYKNNKGVTKKAYSKWNIKLRKVKVK